MKITKFGHCSLLIKTNNIHILTDPGIWSDLPEPFPRIDILLITHEHQDHLHVPSVKNVLASSPSARVITNGSVAKLLEVEGITAEIVNDGAKDTKSGIAIEGYGTTHAQIYETFGQVENTGYMIDGKLFYPGDAFYNPNHPVDILALPVAGPWMHIRDAIDYAKTIKPRIMFPVHDGFFRLDRIGPFHAVPLNRLTDAGLNFVVLPIGEEKEL